MSILLFATVPRIIFNDHTPRHDSAGNVETFESCLKPPAEDCRKKRPGPVEMKLGSG